MDEHSSFADEEHAKGSTRATISAALSRDLMRLPCQNARVILHKYRDYIDRSVAEGILARLRSDSKTIRSGTSLLWREFVDGAHTRVALDAYCRTDDPDVRLRIATLIRSVPDELVPGCERCLEREVSRECRVVLAGVIKPERSVFAAQELLNSSLIELSDDSFQSEFAALACDVTNRRVVVVALAQLTWLGDTRARRRLERTQTLEAESGGKLVTLIKGLLY